MPGAYSEQASLLAYDGCTPAPFDQFENAFEVPARSVQLCVHQLPARSHPLRRQAVEQFLVDRAVLPIENSLGVRRYASLRALQLTARCCRGAFTATLTCCSATACTSWARRVLTWRAAALH